MKVINMVVKWLRKTVKHWIGYSLIDLNKNICKMAQPNNHVLKLSCASLQPILFMIKKF